MTDPASRPASAAAGDEAAYLRGLEALWAAAWPPGMPREPRYPFGELPITDYVREWARRQPDKPAIVFYGREITWARLDALSDRFAALLAEQGIGEGDRVSVFMPNCPQFHVAFLGILKRGAVHAPVSPMSKAFELAHQLEDSGAVAIVALDQLMPVVREVRAASGLRKVFVTCYADFLPGSPTLPLPEMLMQPRIACDDAIDLMPAIEACKAPLPRHSRGLDDPAALNYTGGTTGMPKGCVHTQRDMIYTCASNVGVSTDMRADSVVVGFFPEFWIAGENMELLFPAFAGATLILLARWDALAFMTAVDRYRATNAVLLVDNAVEVMEHPQVAEFRFDSLRQVRGVSFVKKLNVDYRRRWQALTGTVIAEAAWGMTETHTSNTFTTGMQDDDFDLKSQPVFVGLPSPGTQFKICDFDTGALLPPGAEGELCVRTPALLKSYWNKPEASAQALRDGWLHTGDIACIDECGYIHFLGRRKEMLKVNGMSVFPAEIEAMLGQHPAVLGSGVIGAPDARRGQTPIAFVVLKPEARASLDAPALAEWCKGVMAGYKVPEVRIVDELPMTATGKVRKDELARKL